MVKSLVGLNPDCLLEILKGWLLSEDAKVYTVYVGEYYDVKIQAKREESLNQITLTHPLLHELYEPLVEKYAVYVLHVSASNFYHDVQILSEEAKLLFERVRYLRLQILVLQNPWHIDIETFIKNDLPRISRLITQFTNLKDLEFRLTVDVSSHTSPAQDKLRRHMLFNFTNSLQTMSKLVRSCIIYDDRPHNLISLARATHKRTSGGGLELDLKSLRLRCSERECVEFMHGVISVTGIDRDVNLDGGNRFLTPKYDTGGNLTGYTVTVKTALGKVRLKDVNMVPG
jgi:hypothetical protein